MIAVPGGVKVLVATKPVDFRKGADGLAAMVREQLRHDPFSGTIFIFRSKRADRLKILAWVTARRAGGRDGLVASACPRHRTANRDIVSPATD
jgi:transposase